MGLYVIGVLTPQMKANSSMDYVAVELEKEIWTNGKGDTKEEVVSVKVVFDIDPEKATFFQFESEAFDILNTLKKLNAENKVSCESYGREGWGTPGVDRLGVFKLMQKYIEKPGADDEPWSCSVEVF